MAVKKKPTKTSTTTAQAVAPPSLEEETVKEETKKSVVTQVVEVVEEQPEQESTPPVQPEEKETLEEPISEIAPSFGIPRNEEEKKREVVDELFQKEEAPTSQVMPEISVHTKSSKNTVFLWGIGLVAACVAIGGVLVFASKKKLNFFPSVVVMATPTPTPTPKITPTPTPQVTRGAISIEILNGGGVPGAASKMKKFLEDKGYKVAGTTNADAYTYDKTEVLVKPDGGAFLTLLTNDLSSTYSLGTSAATLDSSVQYDARVIVGKQ